MLVLEIIFPRSSPLTFILFREQGIDGLRRPERRDELLAEFADVSVGAR